MSTEKIVCSITNYINKTIPDFNELLKNVCLTKLTEYRSSLGITFIKPNPELVSKYLKDVDNIISDQQLIDIQSFCKKHFLKSSLLHSNDDTVINAERRLLNVEKIKDGFKLTDGTKSVTLKKTNFRLNNRIINDEKTESKISILEPTSSDGVHILVGKLVDRPEKIVKEDKKNIKKGGAAFTRLDIEEFIRHLYSDNMINRRERDGFVSSYLPLMNSLYLYLRKHHNNLYKSLIKISDKSPEVNFYMFIQPFNLHGNDHIISDEMISQWGGTIIDYQPISLHNAFNEEAKHLLKEDMNKNLLNPIDCKAINRDSFENDYNKYSQLVGLNATTLKWMDEFRILYSDKFKSINRAPSMTMFTTDELEKFNIKQVKELQDLVITIKSSSSGSNKRSESILVRGPHIGVNHLDDKTTNDIFISNSLYVSFARLMGKNYNIKNQEANFDALLNWFKDRGIHNNLYTYVNADIRKDRSIDYNKYYLYNGSSVYENIRYIKIGIEIVDEFIKNNKTIKSNNNMKQSLSGGNINNNYNDDNNDNNTNNLDNYPNYEESDEEPSQNVPRNYGGYKLGGSRSKSNNISYDEGYDDDNNNPYGGLSAI